MDEKFSVKSVYGSLMESVNLQHCIDWNLIWKAALPPRIKHFLWLVTKRRILTNFERARRHMIASRICVACASRLQVCKGGMVEIPFFSLS